MRNAHLQRDRLRSDRCPRGGDLGPRPRGASRLGPRRLGPGWPPGGGATTTGHHHPAAAAVGLWAHGSAATVSTPAWLGWPTTVGLRTPAPTVRRSAAAAVGLWAHGSAATVLPASSGPRPERRGNPTPGMGLGRRTSREVRRLVTQLAAGRHDLPPSRSHPVWVRAGLAPIPPEHPRTGSGSCRQAQLSTQRPRVSPGALLF